MWVREVRLADFRSYEHVVVPFEPGVTTLIGANGQGKTNLVEAIAYASVLGSHRVATDAPLVRSGADRAVIALDVVASDRSFTLELELNPGRANRARLNRSPVARPRELVGLVRTVVFAPEDLGLVKGDPSERRRFLDDLLVQRAPRLQGVKGDLDRILKQRNALLKAWASSRVSVSEGEATLAVWDDQLVAAGSELVAARVALLEELAPHAVDAYRVISSGSDGTALGARYVSSTGATPESSDRDAWAALLRDALRLRAREERARGVTLVGPHRDDVELSIGGLPAKGYASHGESWSVALALRIASLDLLQADGEEPVLVLDDVFAELDTSRRARLTERVARAEQVLITAAVEQDVPAELGGRRKMVTTGVVTDGG